MNDFGSRELISFFRIYLLPVKCNTYFGEQLKKKKTLNSHVTFTVLRVILSNFKT